MIELTPEQLKHYFYRSYVSVDGLWFMKAEERFDFDTALNLDEAVWRVMPKIQARMIKSFGNLTSGIDNLFEGLMTKLSIEGYKFRAEKHDDGSGFDVIVTECPWHNEVWAAEFGENITFEHGARICKADDHCIFKFRILS